MNSASHLASLANRTWLVPLLIAALHGNGKADIIIPSDGSDGALVVTQNTEIDLGLAVTGQWNANNSANAGRGIYDPEKWAVVFKYASVTIQGGATVTFKNHPSRAPVVWLVQGDVTINGTVSLDGQPSVDPPFLAEPGPGGFRGGAGRYGPGAEGAAGLGPGGGKVRTSGSGGYGGASYGTRGAEGRTGGPAPYGNPSILPLLGGSGGGGSTYYPAGAGGGGGAIAILASGLIRVDGTISARGGAGRTGHSDSNDSGGGSGGAIRLVCQTLAGVGSIQAIGGGGTSPGGSGRIRIERTAHTYTGAIVPDDASVVTLAQDATPHTWMPENGPSVRIVSIGGSPTPTDPRAGFGAFGADVVLPQVTNTTVVVETANVETNSVVSVRVSPRVDGDFTVTAAAPTLVMSDDPLIVRWTANVPLKHGYAAVQVKVVRR